MALAKNKRRSCHCYVHAIRKIYAIWYSSTFGNPISMLLLPPIGKLVNTSSRKIQVLVLSPSKELTSQTEKTIQSVGVQSNIQAHACIGGKSIGEDIKKLNRGIHVVSGTPGRIYDMTKRGSLQTKSLKLLILDESDEMLIKGLNDQIYDVYSSLPHDIQVCLNSATLPQESMKSLRVASHLQKHNRRWRIRGNGSFSEIKNFKSKQTILEAEGEAVKSENVKVKMKLS